MSSWPNFAAVAAGGALGACSRYGLSVWLAASTTRFPYATVLANLSGAFLAGFIVTVLASRGLGASVASLFIVTGFLGGYTTLSAFSVDTLRLVQGGALLPALVNVTVTVVGAMIAVVAGAMLARAV